MTKRILDISTTPVKVFAYADQFDEEAHTITIDKGYMLFCTESGQVVKLKAKNLGDGIKRLVEFFKDLKKLSKEMPLQVGHHFEKILQKHDIDLEALK